MSGLTTKEWDAITDASWKGGARQWRAEVERIVAAREAAAAEQARAEVVAAVEAGIAQVEELAASATNYGGDLVGHYIKADDWRRVRATFRAALATERDQ